MKNKILNFISMFAFYCLLTQYQPYVDEFPYNTYGYVVPLLVLLFLNYIIKHNEADSENKICALLISIVFGLNHYLFLQNYLSNNGLQSVIGVSKTMFAIIIPVLLMLASYRYVLQFTNSITKLCNRLINKNTDTTGFEIISLIVFFNHYLNSNFCKLIYYFAFSIEIDNYFGIIYSIIGILLVVQLFKNKSISKDIIFLLIFLLGYSVSLLSRLLVDEPDVLYENRNEILNIYYSILFIYLFSRRFSYDQFKLIRLFKIPYYLWTIILLIVVIKVFLNLNFYFLDITTYTANGLCLSIKSHYNTFGMIEVAWIIVGILFLVGKKNLVNLLCFLINLEVLLLTNSRTAFACGSLFIVASIYFILVNKKVKKLLIITMILISLVFLFGLRKVSLKLYGSLQNNNSVTEIVQSDDERHIIDSTTFTLNGRTIIWKYCIDGITKNSKTFMLGVSKYHIEEFIKISSNGDRLDNYTHNIFVEILCDSGIIAFIGFTVWLLIVLKNSIFLLFSNETLNTKIIIIGFWSLLLNNITEARIIYDHYFMGVLFFILSGIIIGKAETWKQLKPAK